MKQLKKFKENQMNNFFSKRVSGGMYSYYNIKAKVYKSQKGNSILLKLKYNYLKIFSIDLLNY